MKLKIVSEDKHAPAWYNDHVGEEFQVLRQIKRPDNVPLWVVDTSGTRRAFDEGYVLIEHAEIIES